VSFHRRVEIYGTEDTLWFVDGCTVGTVRGYGEVRIRGWDIPMPWAIDDAGNAFADLSGHGSVMKPIKVDELLIVMRSHDDEQGERDVRKALAMRPAAPSWMREARKAGWTPPKFTFNENDYDWNDPPLPSPHEDQVG
jgi:hypothetical protein